MMGNKDISQANQSGKFIYQRQQQIISSPLPSAEELKKYEQIMPGTADRIIKMAENQQIHRIELENKVISNQIAESSRGQIFGFILGLIGLLGSISAIHFGFEVSGSIIGGGSLTVLVSIFVLGKKEQRKDLENKS